MHNEKDKIEFILISLCTCKRPKMLEMALESAASLNLPEGVRVEILLIDNDPDLTAKSVVEKFKEKALIPLNYFSEPQRGICYARNRLLKEAQNLGASHIAMFDDDELLDENWLVKHVELYESDESLVISSGPTYSKFMSKYHDYIEKNNIFKSSTTKKTGDIRTICASGNVFFPVSIVAKNNLYFDTSYIFMGGEDGDFFSRASGAGCTIVWNGEAVNYEMVSKERANIQWILKRYYYNGYSGASLKFKNNKKIFAQTAYILKSFFAAMLNLFVLIPSLLFGFTTFLNVLGSFLKNTGKIAALIKSKPVNYYDKICGE